MFRCTLYQDTVTLSGYTVSLSGFVGTAILCDALIKEILFWVLERLWVPFYTNRSECYNCKVERMEKKVSWCSWGLLSRKKTFFLVYVTEYFFTDFFTDFFLTIDWTKLFSPLYNLLVREKKSIAHPPPLRSTGHPLKPLVTVRVWPGPGQPCNFCLSSGAAPFTDPDFATGPE